MYMEIHTHITYYMFYMKDYRYKVNPSISWNNPEQFLGCDGRLTQNLRHKEGKQTKITAHPS